MEKLSVPKIARLVFVFSIATAIASQAQTFTTLASFDGINGEGPAYTSLIQGFDGDFYGTTSLGGYTGSGTIFKITAGGTLRTLYMFCGICSDGGVPYGGLIQATDGNFYGTTSEGGVGGYGTVFKMTPAGALTTLYSFCTDAGCSDGIAPYAGLVQATDGNFYGTTSGGGPDYGCELGCGTVFKITPAGELTTLHSFCSGGHPCHGGEVPIGDLVQAIDGNFYGTTFYGGTRLLGLACEYGGGGGYGTVFKMTPTGALTTLYSFENHKDGYHGCFPFAGLVQGTDGNLYGTTFGGGAYNPGGTSFKITPSGKLTTLINFEDHPADALVQGTDGNFYGTTSGISGPYSCDQGCGTVFGPGTLYSFCAEPGCTDGDTPYGGLVQGTDGNFYGTTYFGGTSGNCGFGCGTVFSLSVGLGSFVRTNPTSGEVGAKVFILGNNLTGVTSVSFNGTPSKFKVVSSTEVITKVPSGATTGAVTVTTSYGALTSNFAFQIQQ